jgi:NitT/TauT family transport system substrate-binding protein
MRGFRIVLSMLLVLLAVPAMAQGLTKVRFIHEWRFEGHVAPYLVALDRGFYKDEGLDVSIDPGTGSVDGINRIATGAYDVGSMDINSLIKYRDGADAVPIKAVLMTYANPPFAVLTLKKNNISKPKDIEGKKLGAPAADAAWQQWPIFAKANDIDTSKITVENVGFPVRETLLAQGQVDAVTAFISNKLALKAIGVPDDQIMAIMMSDYGVDLYGSAIMVNPDFAKAHPDAVKGFVKATIRGFIEAYKHPEDAIKSVMAHNPVAKPEIELERLKVVNEECYFPDAVLKNGFGDVDMGRLQRSIDQLALTFPFKNKPKAEDVFTSEYLPSKDERMVK